ncbi:MAG: ribosome recycling factor [Candidatus Babeliaceae bacterium]|nr:ribosome recycling factor [Candidatus Babeliaceae bacterium]
MANYTFTEGASTKPFEQVVEADMLKHIQHFEKELQKIRTGRAHPSMIEDVKVSAYGTIMPLKEVAAISAPDAQLLVIQPWDKTVISEIEKAIMTSDLGVTPQTDGPIIRIVLPKMSSSRRDELSKVLGKRLEECKIALRNVRKDVHTAIRDTEKDKKISEDYSKRLQDLLQKITDKVTAQAETLSSKKEAEIKAL